MQNVISLVFRRLRAPLVALITVYAVSMFVFTFIPGIDDQGRPWKMSFFHAFYFVSFMGSTIGFGEIPYAFTDAQRMWTSVTIYASVVAWLYAIGTMLSLIQSQGFSQALNKSRFQRKIKRLRDPFYIVCGFGDTGESLVNTLQHVNQHTVVLDNTASRIEHIELQDWQLSVPGLVANAEEANSLKEAGILKPNCKGVIAVTHNDNINLQIAISAKILEPNIKVICRAETVDAANNMNSFGTDLVVNPYETYADDFVMAMDNPSMYLLERWITAPKDTEMTEPVFPPKGRWILCGYGRFGKAMHKRLLERGNPVTVIEEKPEWTFPPENSIIGRGTEAVTLEDANIKKAVGIVAGTNSDVNNLSILLTSGQLTKKIFTILRQELAINANVAQAIKPNMLMDHSHIIASRILENLTTPLTGHFLRLAREESPQWARILISRIAGIIDDAVPETWVLSIRKDKTPAVWSELRDFNDVLVGDLMRSVRDHTKPLPCIPLLLQRKRQLMLLPDEGTPLKFGDRILFCGKSRAKNRMNLIASTRQRLHYSQTGQDISDGWLWNKLFVKDASVENKKQGLIDSSNNNSSESKRSSPKD
ncbi:MAG: voltage-gated potassium channel [Saprospiraceae bacterium]|jgi:voltage-gated potassium channel